MCSYKVEKQLKVVEIYFESPTFDKITHDAKINFVGKISMFGGTMGLFTGFSLLSAFEIVYFILKFLYQVWQNYKIEERQKKKRANGKVIISKSLLGLLAILCLLVLMIIIHYLIISSLTTFYYVEM